MTAATATRPPSEADIRADMQQASAMSGDLRQAIHEMVSIARAPASDILESPDPRDPDDLVRPVERPTAHGGTVSHGLHERGRTSHR